jgi:predicted MFS family arabinose efflux permease
VEPRVPNQRPLRGLFKNSPYVRFAAMYFVISFAMFLPQPLAPNFLQDQRGLSLETIGQLYSLNGIGIVALNLILGQLDSRLGFFLGQIAVGFFSLFLWVGTGLPWYFCAYLLLGGYKAARSLATAQVRSLVEQNNMGVAYGALETVSSAAVILAPLFAGWLYERNPISIYPASLVMILLALGTTLLFMYTHPAASPIAEETLTT